MKTLQNIVAQFAERHRLSNELNARLLDLSSEIGELCKEYNKITSYGQKPHRLNKNFELELGDVFFSLLLIADITGVNIEGALTKTIQKMEKRIKQKGKIGSGK